MSTNSATRTPERESQDQFDFSELPTETTTTSMALVDEVSTRRWAGLPAIALVFVGVGLLVRAPALVVMGAVGVWFILYYHLARPPIPRLLLTRRITPATTTTGDAVTVSVTVKNEGGGTLGDLRIIDGVPDRLAIDSGSPRHATALRPGQQTSFSYTVIAQQGHHKFEAPMLIVRDIAGRIERIYEAPLAGAVRGQPRPTPLPPLPLRKVTAGTTGRIATDTSGPGVEFHSVREYRHGDPLRRIDWNRKARTGQLATVEYRREQMATVLLVVDDRWAAEVGPPGADRSAVDVCLGGAADLFFSLMDAGDTVGVTTLSNVFPVLPPGLGSDHRALGRMLFTGHPTLGSGQGDAPRSGMQTARELAQGLSGNTQIVFLSPLADRTAEYVAMLFEARGHLVTVISPDPSGTDSSNQQLAMLERTLRATRLRERGITVLDWGWDDSLSEVLHRVSTRDLP